MIPILGTKEWADRNINLFRGNCPNGCIYCYAITNNKRFGFEPDFTVKTPTLIKNYRRRDYVTMYPSAHDITPEYIDYHVDFLKRFLSPGSRVLIVTKPNPACIKTLCKELKQFKEQIEFRFTVGSSSSEVLQFYEPYAPLFNDRAQAISIAYFEGYTTSLSIEPMLDTSPHQIIQQLECFITRNIWVGKLNHSEYRVKMNGHANKLDRVRELTQWQANDENILRIVDKLSIYSNVKWKDSIREVIERNKKLV